MEIIYKSRKLEKQLNDPKELVKSFGELAVKIKLRLKNLKDADHLAVLRTLPAARCHELIGSHKGELSVDVSGNYRMIFEPYHDPIPKKGDGGLNWEEVTKIRINQIEDYHLIKPFYYPNMTTTLEIAKSLLSPPGDTIQEHIDFVGMSQAELAERMGRPREKINDLIKGRDPLTISTAFQLEKVLGIPAAFWLNSEKSYRKELYELQQKEEFEKELDWLMAFPINEMIKYGWLPDTKEKHTLVDSLLKFFSVASTEEWKRIYVDEEISVAFRVSLAHTQNAHAISAWLRKGEIQAKEIEKAEFDKKKFKEALSNIQELAFVMPIDFALQLQSICAKCGVALVFTQNLPKASISGAARWFQNQPIIQLSGRFKTNDHFWFTFFHEAAHIILHGKKDVFLENVEGAKMDAIKEEQANEFAAKTLIEDKLWTEITNNLPLTPSEIESYAKTIRVAPGIIIGRLQHEKLASRAFGNEFKTKIELFRNNI